MTPQDVEKILKDHLKGVHTELVGLFRGIETSLNAHLQKTEAAISEAMQASLAEQAERFADIEKRLAVLEAKSG